MKFTTITLSLLLALPLAIANPCASGEVGVGLTVFSAIGTEPGGSGGDRTDATIFADNCDSLDNSADTYDFCTASKWFNGYGVACSGSEVR
ncbi:hypothetical protein VF21_05676 [Pseudogymnoascus sp. 05NY08]|nr:hypothetical protein VF21_05676 [Pseudogymnoascus sp. 05NY08]